MFFCTSRVAPLIVYGTHLGRVDLTLLEILAKKARAGTRVARDGARVRRCHRRAVGRRGVGRGYPFVIYVAHSPVVPRATWSSHTRIARVDGHGDDSSTAVGRGYAGRPSPVTATDGRAHPYHERPTQTCAVRVHLPSFSRRARTGP